MLNKTVFFTLAIIFEIFASPPPDLCADVYLDEDGNPITDAVGTTTPRYCEWSGEGAPLWRSEVCCAFDDGDATCTPPDAAGRCAKGFDEEAYCEYAEVVEGEVVCYKPLADVCTLGVCAEMITPLPDTLAQSVCCVAAGDCYPVESGDDALSCGGLLLWCGDGVSNEDGSVTCFDNVANQ